MIMKIDLIKEAHGAKELFDLCEQLGDGVHGRLHLLLSSDDDRIADSKQTYRAYHADGYCFDVSREPYEEAEDETNDCAIDGHEYLFMEGIYEGFKDIDLNDAIELLRKVNHDQYVKQ